MLEVAESVADVKPDDGYVDRRWSVPKSLWEQILEMAATSGINYAELLVILLEDGVKLRMRLPVESARAPEPPPPPPPPWMVVYVEEGEKLLGRLNMRQVPASGELLTIDTANYKVLQRAWSVKKGELAAYLRVEAFEA
jgi:hypothetical protein